MFSSTGMLINKVFVIWHHPCTAWWSYPGCSPFPSGCWWLSSPLLCTFSRLPDDPGLGVLLLHWDADDQVLHNHVAQQENVRPALLVCGRYTLSGLGSGHPNIIVMFSSVLFLLGYFHVHPFLVVNLNLVDLGCIACNVVQDKHCLIVMSLKTDCCKILFNWWYSLQFFFRLDCFQTSINIVLWSCGWKQIVVKYSVTGTHCNVAFFLVVFILVSYFNTIVTNTCQLGWHSVYIWWS